jgi:hypothetical protein
MNERVRVINQTRYGIGIRLANGIERNIAAGTFAVLARDDVEYLMSIAPKLFEAPCQLLVQDDELLQDYGVANKVEDVKIDREEIGRKLAGSAKNLKAWLDTVNEPFVIDIVREIAEKMDLPASKTRIIKEKLGEPEIDE